MKTSTIQNFNNLTIRLINKSTILQFNNSTCNGCLDFMEFKSTQTLVQPTLYILFPKRPLYRYFPKFYSNDFPNAYIYHEEYHALANCNLIQDLQRTKFGKIFKFIKDRFIYQGSKLWSTQDQHKASKIVLNDNT